MNKTSLKLTLAGTVSLPAYARAIVCMDELLRELTKISQTPNLSWQIEPTQGSEVAFIALGIGQARQVRNVIRKYETFAHALETGNLIRNQQVDSILARLLDIHDPGVTSLVFETARNKWSVAPRKPQQPGQPQPGQPGQPQTGQPGQPQPGQPGQPQPGQPTNTAPKLIDAKGLEQIPVLDVVRGRLVMIKNRHGLRASLYENIHDRRIMCALNQEMVESARKYWNTDVLVKGLSTCRPCDVPVKGTKKHRLEIIEFLDERPVSTESTAELMKRLFSPKKGKKRRGKP